MGKKEVFVAVFGHGEARQGLDSHNEVQVLAALARVYELKRKGVCVGGLIFMAGVGKVPSQETLASEMAYVADHCMTDWNENCRVHIFANRSDFDVWGTVQEMQWAYRTAKLVCKEPRIEFVTNRRHAVRATIANRYLVHIPNFGVVQSSDSPPPYHHEFCAYLKLLAYGLRLEKHAEDLRRRFYSGG